ncbi:uncharacterized protein BXZ73DRAFT_76031 [Epithele typhae]|uniref:uncharacterized protein n=1 Tax=Epithele typhae TaxID=378194 RepID=UPI00200831AC|nr:uncharacterized protein BXZ73DRAFT_76031 [Epithele typhae]KAH9939317.1 hypothetical protein BXZ73DRAFT_76031 [Epithele typhae]
MALPPSMPVFLPAPGSADGQDSNPHRCLLVWVKYNSTRVRKDAAVFPGASAAPIERSIDEGQWLPHGHDDGVTTACRRSCCIAWITRSLDFTDARCRPRYDLMIRVSFPGLRNHLELEAMLL